MDDSPCFALSVEVVLADAQWLDDQLLELGFAAIEERECSEGACRVVYSESSTELSERARELARLAAGQGLREPRVAIEPLAGDWRSSWMEHLRPVRVSEQLTLVPSEPEGAPAPGHLYLRPEMAFGYGEHPTTLLIARWLEGTLKQSAAASLLDVGCGSGVLALAALHFGAERAIGVDLEREAVCAARANAELNGLQSRVEFADTPLEALPGRFDLVCVNIEANTLEHLAGAVAQRLAPGGRVALAGLLEPQRESVRQAYREVGIAVDLVERDEDWCLLVGGFRAPS